MVRCFGDYSYSAADILSRQRTYRINAVVPDLDIDGISLVKVPTNRITSYLGSISYEIYLAQGIPLVALQAHIYTAAAMESYVFILFVLIITLVFAASLHWILTNVKLPVKDR